MKEIFMFCALFIMYRVGYIVACRVKNKEIDQMLMQCEKCYRNRESQECIMQN